jgi:WD40 repeat protein
VSSLADCLRSSASGCTVGSPVSRSAFAVSLQSWASNVLWDRAEPDRWNSVVAWSPDSRFIATGGEQSGELNLWDATTGKRVAEPAQASAGFVLSIDFAWDGSLLVTGGTDGTVRLFDTETLKQVGANIPADDNVWTVAGRVAGRRDAGALVQRARVAMGPRRSQVGETGMPGREP